MLRMDVCLPALLGHHYPSVRSKPMGMVVHPAIEPPMMPTLSPRRMSFVGVDMLLSSRRGLRLPGHSPVSLLCSWQSHPLCTTLRMRLHYGPVALLSTSLPNGYSPAEMSASGG